VVGGLVGGLVGGSVGVVLFIKLNSFIYGMGFI